MLVIYNNKGPITIYTIFQNVIMKIVSDTCTALQNIDNLITTETFPVDYGTVVSVECNTGHTLSGDSSITCEKGTTFIFGNEPVCNIGEKIQLYRIKL